MVNHKDVENKIWLLVSLSHTITHSISLREKCEILWEITGCFSVAALTCVRQDIRFFSLLFELSALKFWGCSCDYPCSQKCVCSHSVCVLFIDRWLQNKNYKLTWVFSFDWDEEKLFKSFPNASWHCWHILYNNMTILSWR